MEFDNEISLLLKKAEILNIPSKYVFEGRNLFKEVQNLISTNISLNELNEKFPMLDPTDLAMIYGLTEISRVSGETVLKNINDFYTSLKTSDIDLIRDVSELKLIIDDFSTKINQQFSEEMNKLENIKILQEELSEHLPLQHTSIEVESTILYSSMKLNNKTPEIENGYEIFDKTEPNITTPFVRWNTESKELFKLYKGKTLEERPNYEKVIPTVGSKEIKNSFSFSVWDGDLKHDNIKEATKESYLKGLYNIGTNLLKIKIPLEKGKQRILDRITSVFPLTFDNIFETSISGELYIFDIEINDLLLSHMILNYELLETYLFMKEMSSSFAEKKKQMKIYFRSTNSFEDSTSPSSVTFSINQLYAKGGESVILNNGEKKELNSNEPYIRLKISSADSLKTIDSFMIVFSRLLSYYKSEKDELEKLYVSYIPEFEKVKYTSLSIAGKKIGKNADTKISRLKQIAPDLFITDYARKCLCQFQPIDIPDDEVNSWKKKTFIHKGEEYNRQVLAFPPNQPKWNFVCPEDKYPFPGVKKNTLDNSDKYPGLPCCFVNDQMSETSRSKYNKIYRDVDEDEDEDEEEKEKEEIKAETHMFRTDKILEPGRYGSIPSSIVNLFSNEIDANEFQIRRKGVLRSINSLLHCVSVAVNDPKYLAMNEQEKEEYVENLRETISKSTLPGLLKQELYDFNDSEISTSFNEGFLDPDYYFRAIEEAYNINIFVFAPSDNEEKRLKNKEESVGVMQLPRFKLFPSRSPRPERSTICIYRTLGSERDNLNYPQCELIVSHSEDNEQNIFGKNIYNLLFDTMKSVSRTISWELVSNNNKIDILARDNLYSQVNYFEIFKNAKKQYIDEYGKMRGLYLPSSDEDILIVIPPSSPENLSTSSSIPRPSSKSVLQVLSNPIAISSTGEMVDGFWFSILDLVYGLYVPIRNEKISNFKNLPIGPSNPLGEKGVEVVPRIRKLKRDLNLIMQVFKWLYSLSELTLDEFTNKYVVTGEIKTDSSQIYDLSNIGRTFPIVENVDEGIIEMSKRIPSLFKSNKLFLYSEKFFEGISYLMKMFIKEYVKGKMVVPKSIIREQMTEQDFKDISGVALFLSETDLKSWLSSLGKYPKIFRKIDSSFAMRAEPFIYLAPDEHIYLVQNIVNGDISRAINASYYWDQYKVNPGFRSPEYDEIETPKYVVYGISPANSIVPVENHAGDSLSFYSILQYNNVSHAAMLPLL